MELTPADLHPDEVRLLVGFLCGGVLLGIVGSWTDQLLHYLRR